MNRFVFYSSLKAPAKKAFNQGNGRHGKYIVDGDYIAAVDDTGRAMDFIKVIKNHGKPIAGINQSATE